MSVTTSSVLELLSSIRYEWVFARELIARIESWAISDSDMAGLVDLIQYSLRGVENSNVRVRIENILFQISLIHLEEWEVRKWEMDQAQRYMQTEL